LYITRSQKLCYPKAGYDTICAFVDASHTSEEKKRSCSGFVIFHGQNLVHWGTKLQSLVAPSTTVAEIFALADSLDDILTLKYIIEEIHPTDEPAITYEDNISALRTLDGGNTKRMRYALIKAHFVRDAIELGLIKLHSVSTEFQLADPLTKSQNPSTFQRFMHILFN